MKKLRKIFVIFGVLLALLSVAAIIYFYAFPSSQNSNKIKSYSQVEARAVAESNLGYFETWKGIAISDTAIFYDLNEKPSAYHFEVADYYGKAGYMIISATNREEPVVKISKSADSPIAKISTLVYKLVEGTIYGINDVKSEVLYLGGTNYYAKLVFKEGGEATTKYYNLGFDDSLHAEDILEMSADDIVEIASLYSNTKEKDSDKDWKLFSN